MDCKSADVETCYASSDGFKLIIYVTLEASCDRDRNFIFRTVFE